MKLTFTKVYLLLFALLITSIGIAQPRISRVQVIVTPTKADWTYKTGDTTCPPTSMYTAYNVIDSPKELKLFLETGHWTFPEQREQFDHWLSDKLK